MAFRYAGDVISVSSDVILDDISRAVFQVFQIEERHSYMSMSEKEVFLAQAFSFPPISNSFERLTVACGIDVSIYPWQFPRGSGGLW